MKVDEAGYYNSSGYDIPEVHGLVTVLNHPSSLSLEVNHTRIAMLLFQHLGDAACMRLARILPREDLIDGRHI